MPSANNPPSGAVTVSGNPAQYQALTAVSTLDDVDGMGAVVWRWQRQSGSSWADIAGATDWTYVLTQDEVGSPVRAVASYIDGAGNLETVASAATPSVANVEDLPTGEVTISGAATLQGIQLTAANSLADLDGLGTVSYAWQRDADGGTWATIAGAGSAAYTPVQADVGHTLRVVASYVDQQGTAENVASAATSQVGNVNDAPTGGITLPGIARQGSTLTAVSTVADADGIGAVNWRWQRDDGVQGWHDIPGATTISYVPTQADVGHGLRAVLSYTDLCGTDESVVSIASPPVANVNDAPTGTLTASGLAAQGQTLTAVSTLDDADGMGELHYAWQRSGTGNSWTAIAGATGISYTLLQIDVQHSIRVQASYTDGYGTGESVASAPTAMVANVNDPPTGSVTVTGVAQQNQLLTAANTLADIDGLGAIGYTWQRYGSTSWTTIAGATSSTYRTVQADVGHYVRAVAAYTDGFGTLESVASDATDFVTNVNDPATGSLVVTGTATQYQVLTAAITIADPDGVPAWTPQWQRLDALAGWLNIPGANGMAYTLAQADVGTQVRVSVGFTDQLGTDEFLASLPTAAVANVNDPPTGSVKVTGSALVGQALTASNTLDDLDGRGEVSYAWQRGDGAGGWAPIPGATSATYVPAAGDAGLPLRVVGSYTDFLGTNEAVASASTGRVASVPAEWLASAALFDAGYYLSQNPDVAAAGVNPFTHYMNSGWREGRDPSAFFHTTYYLNQNPDVAAAGINPLAHFAASGWTEGRDPSVAFSVSRYLAAYPDVRAAGVNPLAYHLQTGRSVGRQAFPATPHPVGPQDPLVDAAWYYTQHPDVAASGTDATAQFHAQGWRSGWDPDPYFHTNYYLNQNPDVKAAGIDPLWHFENAGWRENRDPSSVFSVSRYDAANPDVLAAGLDPLIHYVQNGRNENRAAPAATPHATAPQDPLVDAGRYYAQRPAAAVDGLDASADYHANGWRAGVVPNAWFDPGYYLSSNPDVRAAGIDPLAHYEASGWKEGRAPSLLFSPGKYLLANPDVAAAGLEPLAHWIMNGLAENRSAPLPGGTAPADPLVDPAYYDRQLGATLIPTGEAARQQASWSYHAYGAAQGLKPDPWFDPTYYLAHNPDVAAAHVDALLHYETSGWREGRDPSVAFSTNGYLASNPDVAAAGLNPLLHYINNGQFEGRSIVPA